MYRNLLCGSALSGMLVDLYANRSLSVSDRVLIRTPDQRVRVFISSTLGELAPERAAVRRAIEQLRLAPVMFELGARPHPPRTLYRAYLDQSHIFVGIYWERYGWVAPGEDVSGLEDEYLLSGNRPKLIYLKTPAHGQEPRLAALLDRIRDDDAASYKYFSTAAELEQLLVDDLVLLLTERFEMTVVTTGTVEPPTAAQEQVPLSSEVRRDQSLPAPPTPLIGRLRDVLIVVGLLTSGGSRLVTLTGPGGIGKSRLGVAVGERLGDLPDGVTFVPLASIMHSELVVGAVAHALGVSESTGTTLLGSVVEHLRSKQKLLILDNFEHVLAAAPVVSTLLGHCPALSVLVTSRAPLRLSGERELPVPPLSLPSVGGGPLEAVVDRSEAMELFINRVRAVRPDFALTDANVSAVIEICQRLDGLPLALELAAARVRLLPPQEMLSRLDKRLTILTGGPRDLPARQQTLRATIDWSYGLLSEQDKELFARLSIFRGGRSLDAVEALCNPDGQLDVLGALESLIENSLIQQVDGPGGEARFVMLETIHEYAGERLHERADEDRLRRAHAKYFIALVERAESELHGPAQMAWLERLDAELDNLRAALAWCVQADELELGLRLAGASRAFWPVRGAPSEWLSWLDALLQHGAETPPAVRAKALLTAGFLHTELEQFEQAERDLRAARRLYSDIGDRRGLATALNALGGAAAYQEDYYEARSHFQKSLALRRETGEAFPVASCLANLTTVALCQSEDDLAADYLAEGLPLARTVGDPHLIVIYLGNASILHLRRGGLREAMTAQLESLDLAIQLGDLNNVARGIEGAAVLAGTVDDTPRVARLWGAATALRQEAGTPLPPPGRCMIEPAIDDARTRLGSEEFRTEEAQGALLSRDEAVQEARSFLQG
jgi:predicted ATPase